MSKFEIRHTYTYVQSLKGPKQNISNKLELKYYRNLVETVGTVLPRTELLTNSLVKVEGGNVEGSKRVYSFVFFGVEKQVVTKIENY